MIKRLLDTFAIECWTGFGYGIGVFSAIELFLFMHNSSVSEVFKLIGLVS